MVGSGYKLGIVYRSYTTPTPYIIFSIFLYTDAKFTGCIMKGDYIYGYFYLHSGYYRSIDSGHEYYENYRLDRSS